MAETKLGTTTFLRRAGITAPAMRVAEAAGVIAPSRTDTGWRQFTEQDVRAAIAWKASRRSARPR
jgi:DNA-binding transcriptional MerR regulator